MSSKYHDFLVIYIIMLILVYKKSKERIGLWSECQSHARFHPLPLLNDIGAGWEWDSIQMSIRCQLLVFQAPTDMLPWCRASLWLKISARTMQHNVIYGAVEVVVGQWKINRSWRQVVVRGRHTCPQDPPAAPPSTLASSRHVAPNIFLFILFGKRHI